MPHILKELYCGVILSFRGIIRPSTYLGVLLSVTTIFCIIIAKRLCRGYKRLLAVLHYFLSLHLQYYFLL